ncbi:hypothetical protein CHL67_05800 [Prosthecochloris sp. GSB1]|nr:hypothetical protein CHL67_05800 [Prosthecochloris sp. GSB1]
MPSSLFRLDKITIVINIRHFYRITATIAENSDPAFRRNGERMKDFDPAGFGIAIFLKYLYIAGKQESVSLRISSCTSR